MTCRSTGHREAGFTLIEVLATLVVIGIVLPVALAGLSLATQAGTLAKQQAEAASLADRKLAEVVASGQWSNGNAAGDFEPDYPDYRWQMQTIARDSALSEVTVQVSWMLRNQERSVRMATLVYSSPTTQ